MGVRYANRTDDNQEALVKLWRKMGATVLILSGVGKGCPDVLLGINGKNALVEIKDGSKTPSKQKLTPLEEEFHDSWRGHVCVIKNEQEAAQLIYNMRDRNGG